MTLNWTTTDRAGVANGIKCVIYGKAGYGKTTMMATAPAPIIISAEAGLLSLKKFKIPVLEVNDVADLIDIQNWILTSAEAKQFATICLDSISEIAEVVLTNAKKQVKDNRQAYGELIEKMGATIREFRDLKGYHVVMSAKQAMNKDEHTGRMLYGPMMPGAKLGEALPYFPDEVLRLGLEPDPQNPLILRRFLQTQPDFQYDAKDRSGALDPIEPPDLNHIFTKILSGVK